MLIIKLKHGVMVIVDGVWEMEPEDVTTIVPLVKPQHTLFVTSSDL